MTLGVHRHLGFSCSPVSLPDLDKAGSCTHIDQTDLEFIPFRFVIKFDCPHLIFRCLVDMGLSGLGSLRKSEMVLLGMLFTTLLFSCRFKCNVFC